ncbi:Tm-1-like ATP-binding domain-containing protein [Sulfitobacter sp. TSTF-M16]|uniref:Tm-1-like ATP-binding domain-containing protein n=1 Tax=Sulfitobacter aestuariivivens TaxID=2766981 RepID=A0A927D8I0_9RHOB|nr:Tm-1-like ATP-binding domain-containing protein [Sulfitobacter aestuariivivens]MBD3666103.1 Tm-1-like ATP-binding domain-containing protein [Sulfitobacter aestuariivivens]
MTDKTILIVGTFDTKNDELAYMAERIRAQGGGVLTMDISVLGDPDEPTDVSKHQVAEAGGSSIRAAIDQGEESVAMQIMADGASTLAARMFSAGAFDGVVILGGSMGTDAALDICQALPLGVPKYVVSTVSFSPIIPPDRLSADIQMILWAGGLYGLNSICKASLSQAAGAVLGAARAVEPPTGDRPMVGMTSLGSSCLTYMKLLKPALEERGFDVAIFHATGMGGMAYESIAREGGFACVMDLALPELGNLLAGSVVNGGADRMLNAGRAGIPQIVAPGCLDLIDFAGWQDIPARYKDRPFHPHNRLIKSSGLNADERRETAREIASRLKQSDTPAHVILPNKGIEEWDKPGGPAHDPEAFDAFCDEMRQVMTAPLRFSEIDCHINDQAFADTVLAIFDGWVADGTVSATVRA